MSMFQQQRLMPWKQQLFPEGHSSFVFVSEKKNEISLLGQIKIVLYDNAYGIEIYDLYIMIY